MMKKYLIRVLLTANLLVWAFWFLPLNREAISPTDRQVVLELEKIAQSIQKGSLRQIQLWGAENPRKSVVAFIPQVSSSCDSWRMLQILNEAATRDMDVHYLALLPQKFAPRDALKLKQNWSLPFQVEISPPEIGDLWHSLGESTLDGMVLFFEDKEYSIARGSRALEKRLNDWRTDQP